MSLVSENYANEKPGSERVIPYSSGEVQDQWSVEGLIGRGSHATFRDPYARAEPSVSTRVGDHTLGGRGWCLKT